MNITRPVHYVALAAAAMLSIVHVPVATALAGGCHCPSRCYCDSIGTGEGALPQDQRVTDLADQPADDLDLGFQETFAAFTGDTVALAAPNMVGDFLGGGGFIIIDTQGQGYSVPGAGGGYFSRFRISDNNSPLPQDRVYFNYSHFHNAQLANPPGLAPRTLDINRYMFGAEKTFLCGNMSLQVAAPFTTGLSSNLSTIDPLAQDAQFGELALATKAVLWRRACYAVTGGLAITLPTAEDFTFTDPSAQEQLTLDNDAVHLKPFLGFVTTSNSPWFTQSFIQFDFDTNGNDVWLRDQSRTVHGRYQDQHLLTLDTSVGRWLYRDPCACYVTGLAGIVELHYTTTMNDSDFFRDNATGDEIRNPFNRVDVLNLTSALHLQLNRCSDLRIGTAVPLRREDRPAELGNQPVQTEAFDVEILVQFNRYF